jgi:hypothetical protein
MALLIIPDANSCCRSGCAQLARTATSALLPHFPHHALFIKGCPNSSGFDYELQNSHYFAFGRIIIIDYQIHFFFFFFFFFWSRS